MTTSPPIAASSPSRGPVVVLLGAGRGGTTLLYKVMALHRDVGYLSNYQHTRPEWPRLARLQGLLRDRHDLKLKTWFRDDGGAYFGGGRKRLHALVPVPSEGEPVYRRCGIPLTPAPLSPPDAVACSRLAATFDTIRRHAGAKVLVTKRTANNRRIPWLEAAFPDARYVLLLRDGRAVANSLLKVDWWNDHTLFWSGQTPRQMVAAGSDGVELAARNWVEAMRQIEAGLANIPKARVHQLRYEDLVSSPKQQLAGVMDFIGTPMSDDPHFEACIAELGLRPSGTAWGREWSAAQRERVLQIQGGELARWGYAV